MPVLSRLGQRRARRRAAAQASPGPLRDLLTEPAPDPSTPARRLRLLAVDLETTGLDPRRDHILAIGHVPVDGLCISLSGACRLHVAPAAPVGASATVHGITDDVAASGMPLERALGHLLRALTGRVLLAHHAPLDLAFLSAACSSLWGAPLVVPAVDTMDLQRRLVTSPWQPQPREGELRLWRARQRYGLPVYRPHDPLADALGCAELYLAQVAERDPGGSVTLRRMPS